MVVELKEHHHHTHTALFQSEGAGSKAGIPGGCCGCLFDRYMHGRASKGSTGLNGGLLLKSDKAIICIDCDQQACTSTARTAAAAAS